MLPTHKNPETAAFANARLVYPAQLVATQW